MMNPLKWFTQLGNTIDIAAVADTDRLTWDAPYRENLVHALGVGEVTPELKAPTVPAFPPAMRRMVRFFRLDEVTEWRQHRREMRQAAHNCDRCADYDACLAADQPLVHLCPNRERFARLSEDRAA